MKQRKQRIVIGDVVTVTSIPQLGADCPEEAMTAYKSAVGRQFPVRGINPVGWLEIVLAEGLDGMMKKKTDTIWIEAEHVTVTRRKRDRTRKCTVRLRHP
jgi:hypothetical protein